MLISCFTQSWVVNILRQAEVGCYLRLSRASTELAKPRFASAKPYTAGRTSVRLGA